MTKISAPIFTTMNSELKSTGHFEPLHDAHAIEQVQISIVLEQPLNTETFASVRKAAKVFESELPGGAELQFISFGQAPLVFTTGPGQMASSGFVMQRSAPNGVIEAELRIERTGIAYRTTLYTRWDAILTQFGKYLKALIATYVAKTRVTHVTLNYVDKFVWAGDKADCHPKLMLRENSIYLPPYAYDSPDLWHSHTGAFIPIDSQTKRLLNVNVDHLDEQIRGEPRRLVSITTVLTDMLNQAGLEPLSLSPEEAFDKLHQRLFLLHEQSKLYFGEVIADDMCKRIALSWKK